MRQCCYKTHREDPQILPKIDLVSTSEEDVVSTSGNFSMLREKAEVYESLPKKCLTKLFMRKVTALYSFSNMNFDSYPQCIY